MTHSLTTWIRSSAAALFVAAGCAIAATPALAVSDISAYAIAVSFQPDSTFDGAASTDSSSFGFIRDGISQSINATHFLIDASPDGGGPGLIKLFADANLLISGEFSQDALFAYEFQDGSDWTGGLLFDFKVLFAHASLGMGSTGTFDFSATSSQPHSYLGNGDIKWTSTQVPEPATLTLVGLAGVGALTRARMRRG